MKVLLQKLIDRFNNLPTLGLGVIGFLVACGGLLLGWTQPDDPKLGIWTGLAFLPVFDMFARRVEKIGDELRNISKALEKSHTPVRREDISMRVLCFFTFLVLLLTVWLSDGSMKPKEAFASLGGLLFVSLAQSAEDIWERLRGITEILDQGAKS